MVDEYGHIKQQYRTRSQSGKTEALDATTAPRQGTSAFKMPLDIRQSWPIITDRSDECWWEHEQITTRRGQMSMNITTEKNANFVSVDDITNLDIWGQGDDRGTWGRCEWQIFICRQLSRPKSSHDWIQEWSREALVTYTRDGTKRTKNRDVDLQTKQRLGWLRKEWPKQPA